MGTLQTKKPIERLSMRTDDRTFRWVADASRPGSPDAFDVDQPYQRGYVWGTLRKQLLIYSLIEDATIPPLIVNDRFAAHFTHPGYSQERCWAYALIDGKQRAGTISGFVKDEFAIPASWPQADWTDTTEDTDDGPYVRWSGPSLTGQRFMESRPVAVCVGQFKALEAEQDMFNRFNFGGVAQGATDLDD